ncbi:MAG: cytochrome c biogenesis protein CcsA [Alphaproteobacteria bacterium]|nr:cytochrome c biogenesis protein CcsA [Alphaproteobacteria bacterium]
MIRFMAICALVMVMICPCAPAQASTSPFSLNDFEHIPVQDQGRVKPLKSFARQYLTQISGQNTFEGEPASAWLARTLFDPARAMNDRVFRVIHPGAYGLPDRPHARYSFIEIAPLLQERQDILNTLGQADPKTWSPDQQALMTLNDNAFIYTQLLRSFSYILPLNLTIPPLLQKKWNIKESEVHTLDSLSAFIPDLKKNLQKIIARKGDQISRYGEDEKEIAGFAYQLQILQEAGRQSHLFKPVPPLAGEEWVSLWSIQGLQKLPPDIKAYRDVLGKMARSGHAEDASQFAHASQLARTQAETLMSAFVTPAQIEAEIWYHDLSPFVTASLLYLFSFFALTFFSFKSYHILYRLALGGLVLGAVIHLAGLGLRIFILERPPVGTLYESILFVSWIGVMTALWVEHRRKDGLGILTATVSGALLLTVAGGFAEGDTLKMLVAVLNTNFWLTVHVLCITIGYGFCVITGIMAHIYLYQSGRAGESADDTKNLDVHIKTLALMSLLFTTVGTILGGIWADQSWGRFWGWDPKENGALLIVLWLAWILHGRISRHLSRNASMAGLGFLTVIVALAWFGVNLLGTGLHSYGFIEGVAASLIAFCAVETLLIGGLWYRARRQERLR